MPISVRVTGSESLARKLAALGEAAQGKMLERALVAGGLIIQNDAKRRAPYRTGNLRRSIHIGGHADLATDRGEIVDQTGSPVPPPETWPGGGGIYIGTDVEYAAPVEYGAGRRPPQPYLRPAIDTNGDAVRTEVAEALRDLLRAALG